MNVILPAIHMDFVILHLQGISVCVMWDSKGMDSFARTLMNVKKMCAQRKRHSVSITQDPLTAYAKWATVLMEQNAQVIAIHM